MFYENMIKSPKKKVKEFEFDVFDKGLCEREKRKFNECALAFNFSYENGTLKNGYGVRELQMPKSTTNLTDEYPVVFSGSQILSMWSFAWFDKGGDILNYYLFYFNDEGKFGLENLFWVRPIPLTLASPYTSAPIGLSCRINGNDYMLFSHEDGVYVYGAGYNKIIEGAPKLKACCQHDGVMYAITTKARPDVVYSENQNILEWTDDVTKHIEFSDDRGNPTKIISLGDYLYVFREFGITRISRYVSSGEFNISNIFESSSFIYPGSIASDGENVYFMTTDGFYSFSGNNVKRIELNLNLKTIDLTSCSSECFEGKYFLACKVDFGDDNLIGCENSESGYVNNAIFIYEINYSRVELLRGVDVKQILALNNPYKSKLVMSFNNDNIGKVGELTTDGKLFGEATTKLWETEFSDFNQGRDIKKLESFEIKTDYECKVTFISDEDERSFLIEPDSRVQRLRCGLHGREFKVRIESKSLETISNFKVKMSV